MDNSMYVPDIVFSKMTKKQKLAIPFIDKGSILYPSKLLFIPINKKLSGYGMASKFAETSEGWVRLGNYDCFSFKFTNQSNIYMRGDFEYGGVVFFLGDIKGVATYHDFIQLH